MSQEATQIIIILSALIIVVVIGVIMLGAAREARSRNKEIGELPFEESQKSLRRSFLTGDFRKSLNDHFSSSVPRNESIFVKAIAVGAIAFISIFLLFAAYAVYRVF